MWCVFVAHNQTQQLRIVCSTNLGRNTCLASFVRALCGVCADVHFPSRDFKKFTEFSKRHCVTMICSISISAVLLLGVPTASAVLSPSTARAAIAVNALLPNGSLTNFSGTLETPYPALMVAARDTTDGWRALLSTAAATRPTGLRAKRMGGGLERPLFLSSS